MHHAHESALVSETLAFVHVRHASIVTVHALSASSGAIRRSEWQHS
jgi:hypothetical protein